MKVLVGVDGSERSFHAVEFVTRLLSAERDEVVFYFSPPKLKLEADSDLADEIPRLAQESLVETVFDRAKAFLPPALQKSAKCIVGHNKPSEGLLAAAEQEEADVVTIGAHSARRRPPLFLGGTARKIAHESEQPVLLVRESQPTPDDHFNVLICCDQEGRWQETIPVLQQFQWPDNATAILFQVVEALDIEYLEQLDEHVVPSFPAAPKLLEEYRATVALQEDSALQQLKTAKAQLSTVFQNVEPKVAHGHVLSAIIDTVRSENIDLVVVGARRLGRLGRLLGSTTEGLLVQCPCSLLIVHERAEP